MTLFPLDTVNRQQQFWKGDDGRPRHFFTGRLNCPSARNEPVEQKPPLTQAPPTTRSHWLPEVSCAGVPPSPRHPLPTTGGGRWTLAEMLQNQKRQEKRKKKTKRPRAVYTVWPPLFLVWHVISTVKRLGGCRIELRTTTTRCLSCKHTRTAWKR